jgi:hypothetical protein
MMSENTGKVPLAKVFRLKELPGRVQKYLLVPAGRLGVAVYGDGRSQTFPPDRHRVLSILDRIRGRGVNLRAGFIPAPVGTVRLTFSNLLSGDSELVDASLICGVEVKDAPLFFLEQVVPRQEIQGEMVDVTTAAATQEFAALVRHYLAEDLVHGLPTKHLLREISNFIKAVLEPQGLQLAAIELMLFWRADDRVAAAEQALALREKLQEVELQEKMLAVESQAQLDEFIDQIEGETGQKIDLRPVIATEETAAEKKSLRTWFWEALLPLITVEAETGGERRYLHFGDILARLRSDPAEPDDTPRGRKRPQRWWLGRVIWMASVVAFAFGLTKFILWVTGNTSWLDLVEIILAIWAFAVVAVLESVKSLYEKREQIAEVNWTKPGATFIDDLTANRKQADKLVREQCSNDIGNMYQILDGLQTKLYNAGEMDPAVSVRKFKQKVETCQQELKNTNFGQPPYVTDLKISRRVWDNLLDYDEQLLVRASALSEDASRIQQKLAAGEFKPEMLTQLEARLDRFHTKFANRNQALRSTAKDQKPFRLDV